MPPGTGDIHLSISQDIKVDGSVIVTTPDLVAQNDTKRGIAMLKMVNVPIFGVIENMAYYQCGKCDTKHLLFGTHRASELCENEKIPLLGSVPFEPETGVGNESGLPICASEKKSVGKEVFEEITRKLARKLTEENDQMPKIKVEL
eukprot:comp4334_c0_seq2/m.2853 comp4334_c0_seq2/g.2853  ORF comp4334_c0_seq2/g.2853 comp4334_c0_seq2/m.2853 type:complete len:146 (+) comp4334_c0_seq2:228-665(+)